MGKYWFNIDVAPIWEQLRRINLINAEKQCGSFRKIRTRWRELVTQVQPHDLNFSKLYLFILILRYIGESLC